MGALPRNRLRISTIPRLIFVGKKKEPLAGIFEIQRREIKNVDRTCTRKAPSTIVDIASAALQRAVAECNRWLDGAGPSRSLIPADIVPARFLIR